MKPTLLTFLSAGLCAMSLPSNAGETVSSKQPEISPTIPADDPWEVTLSMPLWASGVDGTVGVHGYTTGTSASFADIIRNLDMVAAATLEVKKGRWGGWIDGIYLKASVGGDTPGPLLSSLSVGIEQIMLETAVYYRAWESQRGYLDLFVGARYMSIGSELSFGVSDSGVEQVSRQLSSAVVDRVVDEVTSVANSAVASAKTAVTSKITALVTDRLAEAASKAAAAKNQATDRAAEISTVVAEKSAQARDLMSNLQSIAAAHPKLIEVIRNSERLQTALRDAVAAGVEQKVQESNLEGKVAAAQQAVTSAQQTVGAVQSTIDTARSALATAQAELEAVRSSSRSRAKKAVEKAEKKLASAIEDTLRDAIPSEVSETIDWVDPIVGVRALYNFTDRFYGIVKADIGGFGVSSDLTWSAYGALGYHVTKSGKTTIEVGYKHMYVDYTSGGFTFDMATSGPMINLGLKF